MLEVKNISHDYEGKPLLNGVSFNVGEKDTLCLLGPSGSGKSTILKIIAGIEIPRAGEVFYNGRNITREPIHQRNFGLVFQDYALFPHMNVYENVAFGLRVRHESGSEIERKTREVLAQVGMEKFAERRVTELSGGEQQRVALARTLVVRPSLIMLDEPLGALDFTLRQSLMEELKQILGENGIPAIYVTHDKNEALSLAQHIAILHNGSILQYDTPEALFRRPANPWCAAFLGFGNFLPALRDNAGMVTVSNFDRTIAFRYDFSEDCSGEKLTLLLKNGMISPDAAAQELLLRLKALPVQNTYRGDFYDVCFQVDVQQFITLRNREPLPLNQPLEIGFRPQDICVYSESLP